MPDNNAVQKLLAQDLFISKELHDLSDNFAALPQKELDNTSYISFSNHMDYMESLFQEAHALIRETEVKPTDEHFKAVLDAKANIENNNNTFYRIRNSFYARYAHKRSTDREQDLELNRERSIYESETHEDSTEESHLSHAAADGLTPEEQEIAEQEEALAAYEEELAKQEEKISKENKRKKEAARQQKLSREGTAQDAENARQAVEREQALRDMERRAEAARLGMRVGENQPLTDSQLREARIREENHRIEQERLQEESKRRINEAFEDYRRRMEHTTHDSGGVQYAHNDFNPFGGDPTKHAPQESTYAASSPYFQNPSLPFAGAINTEMPTAPAGTLHSIPPTSYSPLNPHGGSPLFQPSTGISTGNPQPSGTQDNYAPNYQSATPHGPESFYSSHQILVGAAHSPTAPPLDNWSLYNAASANSPSAGAQPSTVSPIVEQQMQLNLQAARMRYNLAEGREAKLEAAEAYKTERAAYLQYRTDIQDGRFEVGYVKTDYKRFTPNNNNADAGGEKLFTTPTPSGVTSRSFSQDGGTPTTTHIRFDNVKLEERRYTANDPMRVTPLYEKAIDSRYQSARDNIAQMMKINRNVPGFRVPSTIENEFKVATEAYLGYHRAKNEGTVVVDKNAQRNIPDFSAWQQRERAITQNFRLDTAFGSTVQGRTQSADRVKAVNLEEINAALLKQDSSLKRNPMKSTYIRSFGFSLESYSQKTVHKLGEKAYTMIQSADYEGDAAPTIRTAEAGRNYMTTTAQTIYALSHLKAIDSKQMAKAAANQEFRMFGDISAKSNRELAKMIKDSAPNADHAQKLLEMRHKSQMELKTAKNLEKEFGKMGLKGRMDIVNQNLAKTDSLYYQKLGRSFSKDGMQKALDKEAKALSKKLGTNVRFETRGKDLTRMTAKSIQAEADRLKAQGMELKRQIKLLQAKGSALTAEERKLLSRLIQKHKEVSTQLGRLLGFQANEKNHQILHSFLSKTYTSMAKNARYLKSGAYMLYGFMMRPLQESDMIGVHGLAKAVSISTNHYVHEIVKNMAKNSYALTSWTARKTGLNKAAKAAVKSVKKSAPVVKASGKIHSQVQRVKTTSQRTVRNAKDVADKFTPQKVKTARQTVKSTVASAKNQYSTSIRSINNAVSRAKTWASQTRIGQGILKINRGLNELGEALKAAMEIAKAAGIKVLAALAIFFLLMGFISMIFTSVLGGSSSSVILSPDATEDGKVDLEPYVERVQNSKIKLDDKFARMGSAYDDYRIDYATNYDNTKEILSMMAVYLGQDLNIAYRDNEIKRYLDSLFEDSHPYTTSIELFSCGGCRTDANGNTYCPGNHKRLVITVSVLGFDDIFDADTVGGVDQTADQSGTWEGWTEDNRTWAKNIFSMNWAELYEGITGDYGGYIEIGDLIVEGNYIWPVTSTTSSSGYGWRIHPITGERKFHKGTDIPVPTGTPVHAAADGTVTTARYSSSAGNFVTIRHSNGVVTRYLHNSELLVRAGQTVSAGEAIAISGNTGASTGPHLHFEFIVDGTPIDPRRQYGLS